MEKIIVIPDRLEFQSGDTAPSSSRGAVAFTVDDELVYEHFFADFGPLNLGKLVTFCRKLDSVLSDHPDKKVVYFCSSHGHKRANAVYLITSYCLLSLDMSVEDAFRPFLALSPPCIPFRDAAFGLCTYPLTVLDCLRALDKARAAGVFDLRTFDLDKYERINKLENGDMNWIIPGKFLAFSGPLDRPKQLASGGRTCMPEDYFPYFKEDNVTCVVRLNKAHYDRNKFVRAGVKHVDLFYPDGGLPPDHILDAFMQLSETHRGGIAVHCKAGLGRTGSCIGAYAIKHYGFTAKEFIGWSRICRPGSVIGPQQHWLESVQEGLLKAGGWDVPEGGVLSNGWSPVKLASFKPRAGMQGAGGGDGSAGIGHLSGRGKPAALGRVQEAGLPSAPSPYRTRTSAKSLAAGRPPSRGAKKMWDA
jgi:cell division cycle 14